MASVQPHPFPWCVDCKIYKGYCIKHAAANPNKLKPGASSAPKVDVAIAQPTTEEMIRAEIPKCIDCKLFGGICVGHTSKLRQFEKRDRGGSGASSSSPRGERTSSVTSPLDQVKAEMTKCLDCKMYGGACGVHKTKLMKLAPKEEEQKRREQEKQEKEKQEKQEREKQEREKQEREKQEREKKREQEEAKRRQQLRQEQAIEERELELQKQRKEAEKQKEIEAQSSIERSIEVAKEEARRKEEPKRAEPQWGRKSKIVVGEAARPKSNSKDKDKHRASITTTLPKFIPPHRLLKCPDCKTDRQATDAIFCGACGYRYEDLNSPPPPPDVADAPPGVMTSCAECGLPRAPIDAEFCGDCGFQFPDSKEKRNEESDGELEPEEGIAV